MAKVKPEDFVPDEAAAPETRLASLAGAVRKRAAGGLGKAGHAVGSAIQPGALESLVDAPGMARSAAMGFTDNAASRLEEFLSTVNESDTQNPGWRTEHPEVREKYMQSVADHPLANVAGAIAQPNPIGKLSAASKLGKVGLAAARTGYAGASGKLAQYMGQVDPHTQSDGVLDGAKLPMAIQAGAEVASPLLGKAVGMFRNAANEKAVQAVGLRAGITDRLAKMGIAPDEIPALGRQFLDQKLIPTGLNPFASPLKQTADRSAALMSKSGGEVGDILKKADTGGRFQFDYAQAQKDAAAPLSGITATAERAAPKARELIEDVGKQGSLTPGSFAGANRLKSDAYRNVNWQTEAPMAGELHRKAVSGLRGSIETQVGDSLGADAEAALRSANQRYGVGADANTLATRAMSRDVQKQQFSPLRAAVSSALGGVAGGATGGLEAGLSGAALAPFVTGAIASRGPNVMAHGYDLASRAAGPLGRAVNQSPAAAGPVGSALERYMQPKSEDEQKKHAADYFTGGMGGG